MLASKLLITAGTPGHMYLADRQEKCLQEGKKKHNNSGGSAIDIHFVPHRDHLKGSIENHIQKYMTESDGLVHMPFSNSQKPVKSCPSLKDAQIYFAVI